MKTFLLLMAAVLSIGMLSAPILAFMPSHSSASFAFKSGDENTVLVLPNGARLIVLPDANADSVAMTVFFAVGRGDERGNVGINALLAEVWGDASTNRSSVLMGYDLARTGTIGTEYSEDFVEFWGVCGIEGADIQNLCQTLLVNNVGSPLFTPENVANAQRERDHALAVAADDLTVSTLNFLRGRVFGGSVYGIPALGLADKGVWVKPDGLRSYYNKFFRPNRCVVVVAGRVDVEDIKAKVIGGFGGSDFNIGSPAPPASVPTVDPVPMTLKDTAIAHRAPATMVAVGMLAPGTATGGNETENAHTFATLQVLDTVIGGGKAARLFHELRDTEPQGYDVRTTILPGRGGTLYAAYVLASTDTQSARTALSNLLAEIGNGKRPVEAAELARAKVFLKTKHLRDNQRVRDRAFNMGWAETMGLGAPFEMNYDALVDSVTIEEVNALAAKLFNAGKATVYTLPLLPDTAP